MFFKTPVELFSQVNTSDTLLNPISLCTPLAKSRAVLLDNEARRAEVPIL
jgi:hypothetical protein